MVIRRIISGGQTGADRASLDLAMRLDIPHGGWIPKGRLTEEGPLPARYKLKEMPTASYPERTEKNVLDADGTLIVSHGKLTGGSALTRAVAIRNDRPWLHVDLDGMAAFEAVRTVVDWIERSEIEVLNVAGPRASEDPGIYRATMDLLEAVFYMQLIETQMRGKQGAGKRTRPAELPRTVEQAVARLTAEMPLKDRVTLTRMEKGDLSFLHDTLGRFIRDAFGLWSTNKELLESCRMAAKNGDLLRDDAPLVIIEKLWEKLRETHRLRAVR